MLIALFLLPILASLACYLMRQKASSGFALGVALADLALIVVQALSRQHSEFSAPWLPSLGISLDLRVDELNLFLLMLTPLLTALALLCTPANLERRGEYSACLLLLLGCLQGLFLAQNLGLFYIFWEAMLLPVLVLTVRWGQEAGRAAALKFFLYTLAGSLPMLFGILYLAFHPGEPVLNGGEPNLSFRALGQLDPDYQRFLFVMFFLGFAVKAPLWPLHGWLPDLYRCLPAPVVAVVAGAMSKAGVYGFLKVGGTLLPAAMATYAQPMSILALIGVLYGALCALGARDLRGILAFSSLSHLGFMLLGAFSMTEIGRQGCILQMLNHGICTGGLFLILATLEERQLPTQLSELGGLGRFVPQLSTVFLVLALASLGLPGLCSFAGELPILIGVWKAQPVRAVLACLGVIGAAWYVLRFYQGAMQGALKRELSNCDLLPHEWAALLPLVALVFWIGFWPLAWFELMRSFSWS